MKMGSNIIQGDTVLTKDNLALVTDATSGFSQKQAEKLGYDLISLPVSLFFGEEKITFSEDNNDNETFYQRLADPKLTDAKTGSSIDGFLKVFKQRLSEKKLVVYLGVTDSLSEGTRNAAMTAKQMLCDECPELNPEQNILILPTHCIAGGLGLSLRMIQEWLFSGEPHTLDELKRKVEYMGDHMAHIFTLFSYDFMKRSGRFSSMVEKVKVGLATVLAVYSVMLSPRNGPLQPTWKKVRGTIKLLNLFVDIYAENAVDPEYGEVEIDYSGVTSTNSIAYKKAEELRKILRERFPHVKIRTGQTSPSVGCHVGPDEISFFYLQKEVRPDMLD